jgi:hypothetical protein
MLYTRQPINLETKRARTESVEARARARLPPRLARTVATTLSNGCHHPRAGPRSPVQTTHTTPLASIALGVNCGHHAQSPQVPAAATGIQLGPHHHAVVRLQDELWVTLKPVHDTGQALWGLHGPTVTRLLQSYLLATDSHLVHSPSHTPQAGGEPSPHTAFHAMTYASSHSPSWWYQTRAPLARSGEEG